MGEMIDIKASDGVSIAAYRAMPAGKARGAMVVLQEIFGVNHHIRNVTDRYAAEGYVAIAPALFDRVERGIELGYGPPDMQSGVAIRAKTVMDKTMLDIAAAVEAVSDHGKTGVVGYCWGGTLAYAAACHTKGISAAVGYYGGGIVGMLDESPRVPLMLHFGERDKHIPLSDVDKIRAAHPEVPVFVYEADHGFNCDERASYDQPSADLARKRTLDFFAQHMG